VDEAARAEIQRDIDARLGAVAAGDAAAFGEAPPPKSVEQTVMDMHLGLRAGGAGAEGGAGGHEHEPRRETAVERARRAQVRGTRYCTITPCNSL
jgi:hypothetical protein